MTIQDLLILFLISKVENALAVPLGAVFKSGGKWSVYVIENSRAQLRQIDISKRNDRMALVNGGLGEGDVVILFPGDRIREGSRVGVR